MIRYLLQLTTSSLFIFPLWSGAALYKVIEVPPPIPIGMYSSASGVAIEASDSTDCFSPDADCDTEENKNHFSLAGETRRQGTVAGLPVDGISYRENVPFLLDNEFYYTQTGLDNLYFFEYCSDELMYAESICTTWAEAHWVEWKRERMTGSNRVNSFGFYQKDNSSSATLVSSDRNVVINALDETPFSVSSLVGTAITPASNRGAHDITPISNGPASVDGARAWAHKSYTYGGDTYDLYSGSVLSSRANGYGVFYTSQGALWSGSDLETTAWESSVESYDNRLAQGSVRDFTADLDNGLIYGVGYTSYDSSRNYMSATVFKTVMHNGRVSGSSSVALPFARVGDGDMFTNTTLKAVNDNFVAIGEAKLINAENGSPANKLFIVPDVTEPIPRLSFFPTGTENIGFLGAGGQVNALNNRNEIVGQIDSESSRESSGKPRRKRGFIYPYSASSYRGLIFKNKAWLLDDLTNGPSLPQKEDYSHHNNNFRIVNANDINDAGVIAATAIKCLVGEYNSTNHDATCGSGNQNETTVAVKLVPISGVSSSSIFPRGYRSPPIAREGAALDWLSLTVLLVFFLFRIRSRS